MRHWIKKLNELDRDCVHRYEYLLGRKLNNYEEYVEIDSIVEVMVLEFDDRNEFFSKYPMLSQYRTKKEMPLFTWKDIVLINGDTFAEEFAISGEMDGEEHYQIDDFLSAVAKKHNVSVDDVYTYMMDDIAFDPRTLPFGAEDCGCYIDGTAEWLL